MKHLSVVVALATALMVSACSTYVPGTVPADAQRMTANDIHAAIERARQDRMVFVDSFDAGLRYNFGESGRLTATSRNLRDKTVAGQWRVTPGDARLCIRIEDRAETCNALYRVSSTTFYVDEPGGSQRANTIVMQPAK